MPKPLPSTEYLRECFDYDPLVRDLVWRTRPSHHFPDGSQDQWNGKFAGRIAGYRTQFGYCQLEINHVPYLAHRIIWKLVTGEEPPITIDHINHDGMDNRWANFRGAAQLDQTRYAQRALGKSGVRGVHRHGKRWRAQHSIDNRTVYIGSFATREEAEAAREAVVKAIHGEFYCP